MSKSEFTAPAVAVITPELEARREAMRRHPAFVSRLLTNVVAFERRVR